jgi:TolB-like protein
MRVPYSPPTSDTYEYGNFSASALFLVYSTEFREFVRLENMKPNKIQANWYGPFEVTDRSGESLLPRGKKQQAILAYLLMNAGKRIPRHRIVEVFWSGRYRDQALGSLRRAICDIKSALGPSSEILVSERDYLLVVAHGVSMETKGDLSRELLEGFPSITPEFDIWVKDQRNLHRHAQTPLSERPLVKWFVRALAASWLIPVVSATALLYDHPWNNSSRGTSLPTNDVGISVCVERFFHPAQDKRLDILSSGISSDIRRALNNHPNYAVKVPDYANSLSQGCEAINSELILIGQILVDTSNVRVSYSLVEREQNSIVAAGSKTYPFPKMLIEQDVMTSDVVRDVVQTATRSDIHPR